MLPKEMYRMIASNRFLGEDKESAFILRSEKICHLELKTLDSMLTLFCKNVIFFWMEYTPIRTSGMRGALAPAALKCQRS